MSVEKYLRESVLTNAFAEFKSYGIVVRGFYVG